MAVLLIKPYFGLTTLIKINQLKILVRFYFFLSSLDSADNPNGLSTLLHSEPSSTPVLLTPRDARLLH